MKEVKDNFSKNVDKIYGRIKSALALKTDSSLARTLNILPSSLFEYKRRGTIPWERMFWLCEERNINFHWVITGRGPKYLLPQRTGGKKVMHLDHAPIINMMNFLYETWIDSSAREKIWLEVQFEKCFTSFLKWVKRTEGKEEEGAEGKEMESRKEGTNGTELA